LGIPAYSNANGQEGVITAAHCAQTGHIVQNGNGSRTIGWTTSHDWYTDSSFTPTDAGSLTWDGEPSNAASYRRTFNGSAASWYGDWLCQLGATTGWRCNLFVWSDWYTAHLSNFGYQFTARGVETVQTDGVSACIDGDSGGPVVAVNDPSSRQLRGIVSAHGWDSNGQDNMFFIEAFSALNAHNASPNF
jgi:hypothetical protein